MIRAIFMEEDFMEGESAGADFAIAEITQLMWRERHPHPHPHPHPTPTPSRH